MQGKQGGKEIRKEGGKTTLRGRGGNFCTQFKVSTHNYWTFHNRTIEPSIEISNAFYTHFIYDSTFWPARKEILSFSIESEHPAIRRR